MKLEFFWSSITNRIYCIDKGVVFFTSEVNNEEFIECNILSPDIIKSSPSIFYIGSFSND